MTDYRLLSLWERNRIDKKIMEEVEPKHHTNKHNGFEWDEPDSTLDSVHCGRYCAECWRSDYTCLCGHE